MLQRKYLDIKLFFSKVLDKASQAL